MARQHTSNRNSSGNHHSKRRNYNWAPGHREHKPRKDWQDIHDRADDQIAPKYTSQTTHDLQRWALATADFPQQGHRSNENETISRIDRRYGNDQPNHNAPFPRFSNIMEEEDKPIPTNQDVAKRQRSVSPPLRGIVTTQGLSAVAYMRESKRRRAESPSQALPINERDETAGSESAKVTLQHEEWTQSKVEVPSKREEIRTDG